MADDNTEIDDRKVQHTREHDFQGGLKKNGSDIGGGSYTDEDAQDAVGTILTGDFTYNDSVPSIDLSFDPATQTELNNHANTSDAHHAKYTDEESQDAVGTILTSNFTYNDSAPEIDLSFDPATQTELDSHAGTSDAHHAKYTDEEAQDAVGNNVGDGLSYDDGNAEVGLNVVASGVTTLSNGEATIDTGVTTAVTATFQPALGPASNDVDVAAEVRSASGGNYEVDIVETDTNVGNPTVEYDIIRVR